MLQLPEEMPQRDHIRDGPIFAINASAKTPMHMAAYQELDFTYEILGVAQEYGLDSILDTAGYGLRSRASRSRHIDR